MKLGREVAKDLVEAKKPRNKKQLLVAAGYSEITASASPQVIFNQEGTKKAIEVALESQGFTEARAKQVVAEILDKKFAEDKDRLKAAELIFKVHGTFAAEKSINMNVNSEDLRKAILDDLNRFRAK